MAYTIYHNPRCRKSRETLQILQDNGLEPEVHLYLENPLGVDDLRKIADLLGMSPLEFMRKGETAYKEFIKDRDLDEESLFEVMAKHPILMERPIVVKDNQQAVIGRPPEEVEKLLA